MAQNIGVTWITNPDNEDQYLILVDNSMLIYDDCSKSYVGDANLLKWHSILAFPYDVGVMARHDMKLMPYWFCHKSNGDVFIILEEHFNTFLNKRTNSKKVIMETVINNSSNRFLDRAKSGVTRIVYSLKVNKHMITDLILLAEQEIRELNHYISALINPPGTF
ncbi:hypothetical protein [Paenibacillus naphthalenovorans]|uniref:hypothetical protein n=1 Tax=Paenibacillus naphthalenovorans TaxID=162209 RepID=UPI003D2B239C